MTAVTLQAPEQGQLDGVEPPVQTPAQLRMDEALRAGAFGHLARPAVVYMNDRGDVVVEVLLQQHVHRHPRALPLLAAWHYPAYLGPGATFDRASRLVLELNEPGAEITALGFGLELGTHQGREVLRLIDCIGICPSSRVHPPTTQGETHAH